MPTSPRLEPPDLPDYSTKAGAQELAGIIRRYWKFRGHTVSVETFVLPGTKTTRNYEIRSNLVNGLPRQVAARVAA